MSTKIQSSAVHTPGPWECRFEEGRHYVASGLYQIVEQTWGTIEARDKATTKANTEERAANARLIAAAPDMLAALKEAEALVVGWACHYAMMNCKTPQEYAAATKIEGWHQVHREIYQKVKAAIAKAEGGQ